MEDKRLNEEKKRMINLFNDELLYGNLIKEENVDEGLKSTFKGIGGFFRGTGYNYTKYAYELSGTLKELNENLSEGITELEKIINKSNKSKMSNVAFDRLETHVADAIDTYKMTIDTNLIIIDDLDFSVSSNREDERPQPEAQSQLNR